MKKILQVFAIILSVFAIGLFGCSKADKGQSGSNGKAAHEDAPNQQAEKIRETLRAPIDKARQAHDMGDERTNAIDEAIKTK